MSVERIPATCELGALLCASDEYITSINDRFTPADQFTLRFECWSVSLNPPAHFFHDTPEVRRILQVAAE